jgi:hypothetical protein
VILDTPVQISANVNYTVSVESYVRKPWACTAGIFALPIVNGDLTATAGVYGNVGTFPTTTTGLTLVRSATPAGSNWGFFRDVVFIPS